MDQHQGRELHVEASAKTMFGEDSVRQLIEPPLQLESHLYQTLQCADWICGLVGRLQCYRIRRDEYKDLEWAEKYFGSRIDSVAACSSIKKKHRSNQAKAETTMELAFKMAQIDTSLSLSSDRSYLPPGKEE